MRHSSRDAAFEPRCGDCAITRGYRLVVGALHRFSPEAVLTQEIAISNSNPSPAPEVGAAEATAAGTETAEPSSPSAPGDGAAIDTSAGPGEASPSAQRFLRYTLPSLAVAGGLGLLEMARQRFQHGHMFEPEPFPDDLPPVSELGIEIREVELESEDGTRLHGWWMPHPKDRLHHHRERMAVVYCHGNSGNIATRLEIFRALQRLDVDIFAFDYRGYGKSGGVPTEAGVCADVRAALDFTVEQLGVPWHRVILFGHSLGGAVAIDGAWHRREVAGLVVQSSFTQVVDMARHFYPELPVHWIARNGFLSVEKVKELEMPKLFVHGGQDPTIPFAHGEALHQAAAEPKAWLPVARATHNDVHLWGGLRYYRALTRFRRQAEKYGLSRF